MFVGNRRFIMSVVFFKLYLSDVVQLFWLFIIAFILSSCLSSVKVTCRLLFEFVEVYLLIWAIFSQCAFW